MTGARGFRTAFDEQRREETRGEVRWRECGVWAVCVCVWKGGPGYEVDVECGCGVDGSTQVEGVWSVGSVCGVAPGL